MNVYVNVCFIEMKRRAFYTKERRGKGKFRDLENCVRDDEIRIEREDRDDGARIGMTSAMT